MTTIDIILLLIALTALVTGAMKGFVRQIGTIVGLVGGVLVCRMFGADVVGRFVARGTEDSTLLHAAVYAGLFIAVFLGVALLAHLLGALLSAIKLRPLDRIGGALFRLGLWMLIVSLLINVYLGMKPDDKSHFEMPSKPWRTAVADFAPTVLGYIAN